MTDLKHPARKRSAPGPSDPTTVRDENAGSNSAPGLPAPDAAGGGGDRLTLPAGLLHDLRTPLNQIIGFTEILTEQTRDEGQDGYAPDLNSILIAGGQLLTLINNSFQTSTSPASSETRGSTAAIAAGSPGTRSLAEQPVNDKGEIDGRFEAGGAHGVLLVVDDNAANRDVLSRRLKRQGHDVVMAENGRDALTAMRTKDFDLVLLDVMMPEMDGYEVLRQLKADEALCHIPVIMISALHELESIVRCVEMGADDYLFKPFDPPLLKARIGACLEKKRARDREVRLFEQLGQNFKRLQELEKLHEDLTNMIVHDLRTPLTSLITGIYTLEAVGDLNDDQKEMVGISLAGGETLLGMINDLLDVEKLESGAMELDYSELSANDVIASSVSQIASLAEGKHLTIIQRITPGMPPLSADENKLRRILVNLLGNAIKFTPSGGTVTLEANFSLDTQSCLFSVTDTGEGIPPEAYERIFEKFGQVASRKGGRTMSTGLGLTFCKLAVEAHGGRIEVVSPPGQGSTFSFTLPVSASEESAPDPSPRL